MATTKRFRVVLERASEHGEATGIYIPFDVQKSFGTRARVPVRGTINGFPFRTSISPMGGRHCMAVNMAMREGAKAKAGDIVNVVLERDDEPRVVEVPPDLARALKAHPAARARWEKLSYTHRKEYAREVEEAKKPDTRARRIEKTVAALTAGALGSAAR